MSDDSSGRRSHNHIAGPPGSMTIPSGPRHHHEWRQGEQHRQRPHTNAASKRKWVPPNDTSAAPANGKRFSSSTAYPHLPGAGAGAASPRADPPAVRPGRPSQQPRKPGEAAAPPPTLSLSRATAAQPSPAHAMPSRGASRSSPPLDYEEGEISEESDDDESEEIARMLLADSRTRKKARLVEEEEEEGAAVQSPRPVLQHDVGSLEEARPLEQELRKASLHPGLATAGEIQVSVERPPSPMQLVQSPIRVDSHTAQLQSPPLLPSPPRSPHPQTAAEPFRFDPTSAPFSPAKNNAALSPLTAVPAASPALEQLLEDTQTAILELQSWGVQPDYMFNQGADKDVVIRTYLEFSLPLPKHHEAYYRARLDEGLVPSIPGLGTPESQPQPNAANLMSQNATATSAPASVAPEDALRPSTRCRSSSPQQIKRIASASAASQAAATAPVQAALSTRQLSLWDDTVHAPARLSPAPLLDAPTSNSHLRLTRPERDFEPSMRQDTRHPSLPPKPQLPAYGADSATMSLQPDSIGVSVLSPSLPASLDEMPQLAPVQPVAPTMTKTPSQELAEKEATARERLLARKAAMLAKKSVNLAQEHIETQLNGLLAGEVGLPSTVLSASEPAMQMDVVSPGEEVSLASAEMEGADDVEMQISDGEEVESDIMTRNGPEAGSPAGLASESTSNKPEDIGETREKLLELGDEASDTAVGLPFPGGPSPAPASISHLPEPQPADRLRAGSSQPLPTPPLRSRPVAFDFEAEPAASLPNVPRWSAHLMPDSAAARRAASAMVIVLSDDEDSGDDSDSDGLRAAVSETKLKEQAAINLAAYASRPANPITLSTSSSSSSSFMPRTALSNVWQSSSAQGYSAPSPKSLPASREQSPGAPAAQPPGPAPSKLNPSRHDPKPAAPVLATANSQVAHTRAATPSAMATLELEAKQAEIQRMMDMISQREGKKKRAKTLNHAAALSVETATVAPSGVVTPVDQRLGGDAPAAPVSRMDAHAAFSSDTPIEQHATPATVDEMQGKIERLKEELRRRKQQGKLVPTHTPGKGDSDGPIRERSDSKGEGTIMVDLPAGTAPPSAPAPALMDRSTSPQDEEAQSDTSDDTLIITKVDASPFPEETRSSAAPSDTSAEVLASQETQDANMDIGSQETQVLQLTEASELSPEGDTTLHPAHNSIVKQPAEDESHTPAPVHFTRHATIGRHPLPDSVAKSAQWTPYESPFDFFPLSRSWPVSASEVQRICSPSNASQLGEHTDYTAGGSDIDHILARHVVAWHVTEQKKYDFESVKFCQYEMLGTCNNDSCQSLHSSAYTLSASLITEFIRNVYRLPAGQRLAPARAELYSQGQNLIIGRYYPDSKTTVNGKTSGSTASAQEQESITLVSARKMLREACAFYQAESARLLRS